MKKIFLTKGNRKQSGFITIIIVIIAALVLLKYAYDIDVVNSIIAGNFKDLFDQIYNLIINWWGEYGHVILNIWNSIIDLIKKTF